MIDQSVQLEAPPAKSCGDKLTGALLEHWTVPEKIRSDEQDAAEKYLLTAYIFGKYMTLPWFNFNRWYLFFASFMVQSCIGSLYSWSVLNNPIDMLIYGDKNKGMAVNAFYIAVGVFGTSTAIMGPWIERNGPRAGVMLGATSFFIGCIISCISLHAKSIVGLYIGYGLFCGFGSGLCYISPVSALQKWFPDHRGAAAGFAVGGYGAGSVVWGKAYLPIIDATSVADLFIVIGCVMVVTLYACAVRLRNPHCSFQSCGLNMHGEVVCEVQGTFQCLEKDNDVSVSGYEPATTPRAREVEDTTTLIADENTNSRVKKLTLIQAITSPDFIFLYIAFFGNQLYGLIVLSKLSTMCTTLFNKTANDGANIVSINSVFNCVGRLLFPLISDLIVRRCKVEHAFARKCLFFFGLASQITIIAIFPTLIRSESYTAFIVLVFLLTLSYGGGFGTIPCFLTDMFGAYNIGALHGFILTAWSLGGVAGGLSFNAEYNSAIEKGETPEDAYVDGIHKILVVVCITSIAIFMVRTNPRDRFERGYHYTLFDRRVISILPRDSTTKKEGPLQSDA
uniref:Major Facilitator Superfamily (MFS) n=1 Tax=Peronospora matthiolae TaxID=2874970 RepID=A0AAV1U832_9STRA